MKLLKKQCMINYKLVTKVNNIETSGLDLKTKYTADKSDLENKVIDTDSKNPDSTGRVKKIDYNAKTTEIEGKKPNISGLATTCALTAVENDIPYVIKKNNNNNRL